MERELYTGLVIGGPMEGQHIESRFPGSILFVSKPTNKAWLYDYYEESARFMLRPLGYDSQWDTLSDLDKMSIIQGTILSGVDGTREFQMTLARDAAASNNTEVRALPEEVKVV